MIKLSILTTVLKFIPYLIPFVLGSALVWLYHDYQAKSVIVDSVKTVNEQQKVFIGELERIEEQRREDETRRQEVTKEIPKDWANQPADPVIVDVFSRLHGDS